MARESRSDSVPGPGGPRASGPLCLPLPPGRWSTGRAFPRHHRETVPRRAGLCGSKPAGSFRKPVPSDAVRGSLSSPAVCDRRINPSGVLGVTAGRSTGRYIFIPLSASSGFARGERKAGRSPRVKRRRSRRRSGVCRIETSASLDNFGFRTGEGGGRWRGGPLTPRGKFSFDATVDRTQRRTERGDRIPNIRIKNGCIYIRSSLLD